MFSKKKDSMKWGDPNYLPNKEKSYSKLLVILLPNSDNLIL